VRHVELDPIPAITLSNLHDTQPVVAAALEECLDWIEAEPLDVRARRRRFSNGMWAIVRAIAGSEWLILWEEDPVGQPVVRFLGETLSL
jgi:hypothetical protein